MYKTLNEYSTQTFGITLNAFVQISVVLVVAAVVVWAVLFTSYPPLHDSFHELRHSLYVVPCH
ncbi:MAG: CbtB-domain containing protein [Anaerolineae bacterium]|nr:CbtB-domain containing protein [Anaerolineae bacterium]